MKLLVIGNMGLQVLKTAAMFGKTSSFAILVFFVLIACESELELENDVMGTSIITQLPYYNTPDFDPIWDTTGYPELHTVFDFSLTDQNGTEINQATVENKIYITNFFFTACGGICPKMMRNMEYLQNELQHEPDVLFLSHSVMPERDSTAQLKTYCNNFQVDDEKWHLLTGDRTEIYDLARRGYFAEKEPGFNKDSTEFLHTEHFILVDKNRHIRGIYNGTIQLEMDRIVADIQLLLIENE